MDYSFIAIHVTHCKPGACRHALRLKNHTFFSAYAYSLGGKAIFCSNYRENIH